ncbi:MAG: 4Fe-4S ferredoxin, partial [Magnetococcales bacterium]|nr:4Fe-4S ferredoxin [Magnetococcales bacterium]
LCGRCVEFCPDDNVLALRFGPITLFKSSNTYFRRRSSREKPDGTAKKVQSITNNGENHG